MWRLYWFTSDNLIALSLIYYVYINNTAIHRYHSLFSGVKTHKSGITIEIYHSINAEQGQITVYTIYETNNFHVMKSCDIVFQFFKILGGGGGGGLMVGWTDEPLYRKGWSSFCTQGILSILHQAIFELKGICASSLFTSNCHLH